MDSDARDRIVNAQPRDFLHRIASIVPGYEGYVDKERRRDARAWELLRASADAEVARVGA